MYGKMHRWRRGTAQTLLVSVGAAESGAEKAAKINTAFSSHNSDKSLYPLLIQWPLRCFRMTPGLPVSVSLSINKLKPVAAEAADTEGRNKVSWIFFFFVSSIFFITGFSS